MLSSKKGLIIILVVVVVMFVVSPSFAHKVMIFGWVEGDTVQTISKFNGGKRVQNAPVSVFDTDDTFILKGVTNTEGLFSFKRPDKDSLKIVLEASMGHKTTCLVETKTDTAVESVVEQTEVETIADSPCPEKNIEKIVGKALDRKIAKVLQLIRENDEKQSISEIIGGIGYILGLVGIALWFKSR